MPFSQECVVNDFCLRSRLQAQCELSSAPKIVSQYDQEIPQSQTTLVNVYVDLVVFPRIAGTSKTGSGRYWC